MVYRKFKELEISGLGMGTMRYPTIDGKAEQIDKEAAKEMFAYAMANGVNYYDTAWGYHGGMSEIVTGELLKDYPRDSFYLASKFPGYDVKNFGKVEEIFEKQLEKCQVEYFDFYLIHNVNEENIEQYMDEDTYHTMEYLLKQKENGRIRYLGFSFHGAYEIVKRYLEKYADYMEFAQIQLNWIDWTFQKANEMVELLREYQLPIIVMEPLRGGKLANLTPEHADVLKALRPEETVPAWSFRFLQSLPDVVTVLSGMSNLEQVKDNIDTFKTEAPLTEKEMNTLLGIGEEMLARSVMPCTACRYCTPYCPKELDIPALLEAYNEYAFSGGGWLPQAMAYNQPEGKRPWDCIGCRACEAVCPQRLEIADAMTFLTEKVK